MKKDFILTFLTQVVVLISGLLIFKLAMVQYGDIGFSEFSLVKRNLSYLYTLIFIGLGVAIPRYIAIERGKQTELANNIFFAALLMILVSLALCLIVFILLQNEISFLLFGSSLYSKYIIPILLSLFGLTLHGLIYSYYRGQMFFKYANLIEITNLGILPLLAFLFASDVSCLFAYTGMMITIISSIVIIKILFSHSFNIKTSIEFIPKLFVYGIQRLPGDFGIASLMTVPAIISAHNDGMITAGYISFSISLLALSGQAVAPIGLIMLPKIGYLLGKNKNVLIKYYVKKLFLFSLIVALIGTAIFQLFASYILEVYLGSVDNALIAISKQIMFGAVFYPIYVAMRSVVDAYYVRAYNTISIFVALCVFFLLWFSTNDIPTSLTISLFALTVMTIYFLRYLLIDFSK